MECACVMVLAKDRAQAGETARGCPKTLLAAVFLLAAVRLTTENQLGLAVGALAVLYLAGRASKASPDWSRTGVILIGGFISLRYWVFRTTETLGYAGFWRFQPVATTPG